MGLSICVGVMASYGSYNAKSNPIISSSVIIAITNSMVSFISGFVVWSVLGYLKHINSPVAKETSSMGLAFIAYPTATSEMKGSVFWSVMLFIILFLLGIDSGFSYAEAACTVIADRIGYKVSR